MDTHLLEQYADIKNNIKELEKLAEEMKPEIIEHLKTQGLDTFKAKSGTFALCSKPVWKYTAKVDALAEALKEAKKAEEKSGAATMEQTEYLKFQ